MVATYYVSDLKLEKFYVCESSGVVSVKLLDGIKLENTYYILLFIINVSLILFIT